MLGICVHHGIRPSVNLINCLRMDPLSITASVSALLGTGGTIARALKKVIKLKNAPDCLQELEEELEELQCMVNDVQSLLLARTEPEYCELPSTLPLALKRLKGTLLALEKLIAYDLTTVKRNENSLRIDRSEWLLAENKIQSIIIRARADKSSLGVALVLAQS